MWRATVVLLGAVCVAVAYISYWSAYRVGTVPARGPSQVEIRKLVEELGSDNFAVREAAMQQLERTGKPALNDLQRVESSGDAETRQRVRLVMARIQMQLDPGVVVNGMRFRAIADRRWAAPTEGKHTPIALSLEVTNVTEQPRRYYPNCLGVILTDSKGQKSENRWEGSDHPFDETPTPPLAKNESILIDLRGILFRDARHPGAYTLGTGDNSAWFINDNLSKGEYDLILSYSTVQTPPIRIVIE
jgi:hypothetical protein